MPIPLSAPDGQVYAYACCRCHHVGGGMSIWGHPVTSGPVATLVESSLRDATRCCTCLGCGIGPVDGFACPDCARDQAHRRMWSSIACCMRRGFTSALELSAYLSDDSDDEVIQ